MEHHMRTALVLSLLLAGSVVTHAQSPQSPKQTFGANPSLPFSGAVKAGGLIYVSGTIASSSDLAKAAFVDS